MAVATSPSSATLAQRLTEAGLRPTSQREVVFEVLLAKRDHPTADEVFSRVKERMPTISLATVYNCLEVLVSGGLVRQVNFERGPTRYCPHLHPHAHFHDEATGATLDIDLPTDVFAELRRLLPAGFEAADIDITFRGKSTAPVSRSANAAPSSVTADAAH